ncbi:aldehyde dehydrogenase family protein, partial [Arthrobacter bambusae]
MKTIEHWIGGKYVPAGDVTAPVTNPATGKVTGQVALATSEEADAAVAAAKAAFPAWRDTSLTKRTQVLFAFRELLNARKGELAAIITSEHGKVLDDALGEVTRGQEVVEFACGIP